jgi:hypothetical protein
VRGALSNERPYRDRKTGGEDGQDSALQQDAASP